MQTHWAAPTSLINKSAAPSFNKTPRFYRSFHRLTAYRHHATTRYLISRADLLSGAKPKSTPSRVMEDRI